MKRIIITLCVFLLLGAVVNVAVAWGIAWFQPWNERFSNISQCRPYEQNGSWWITVVGTSTTTNLYTSQQFPSQTQAHNYFDPIVAPIYDEELPGWLRHPPIVDGDPSGRFFHDVGRGWPDHALMHGFDNMIGSASLRDAKVVFGIVAGQHDGSLPGVSRILPLQPIWRGFAINTLFYAAILWLLFAAPGSVRRWRRIHRGLCAKCAYPVGASDVCTECGSAVIRRSRGLPSPAPPAGGASTP